MSTIAVTSELDPPVGYPERHWSEDPFWSVSPELRTDYIAAAARGVGGAKQYGGLSEPGLIWPTDDGGREWRPASFEEWSHQTRWEAAVHAVDTRRREAEARAASTRTCASCGEEGLIQRGFTTITVSHITAWSCPSCAPLLATELAAQAPGTGGRTRGDLARAAAARLLAEAVAS
ncbi:hypothetical protein [Microbacterium sp.]|uniref:hypothetical protein n=1 Tax=Microbacterium sp. TaxID=51671 RepID=UPI003F70C4B3